MIRSVLTVLLLGISVASFANDCKNDEKFFLYDTIPQAKDAGVNYEVELEKARGKNKASLTILFKVSLKLDGSGSQSHAAVLMSLLRCWGDEMYSNLLATETPVIRNKVISLLNFENEENKESFKAGYPKTYNLGKHESNNL